MPVCYASCTDNTMFDHIFHSLIFLLKIEERNYDAMKIGMTSLTFRNKSIETVFEYAQKACVEGIEWGASDKHIATDYEKRVQLVKELSEKYKIDIFSLGSYFNMTDFDECVKTLETAKMLGAPIIRIWADEKSSCDCDENYYCVIVENTRKTAQLAENHSIKPSVKI